MVSNIELFYWFYIKSICLLSLFYSLFLILWLTLISTSIKMFLCSWVTLPQIKTYQNRQRLVFGNMKHLLGCGSPPRSNLSTQLFLRVDNVPAASVFPQLFQNFYMNIQQCAWMKFKDFPETSKQIHYFYITSKFI